MASWIDKVRLRKSTEPYGSMHMYSWLHDLTVAVNELVDANNIKVEGDDE
jgi:hypothetical protein